MPLIQSCLVVLACVILIACANAVDDNYGKGMDAYAAKNFAIAATHLERVAHAGHVLATAQLASMYLKGEGVIRDMSQAAKWFRIAAEKYNVDSQAILGLLYYNGLGVPKDNAQARVWLGKAAKQGDKQAAWVLENLAVRGAMRL